MVNHKSLTTELAKEAGLSTERFPQTSREADIAADAVARDLDRLSIQEQEKALFDLHGIAHDFEEDPETVAGALEQLEKELENIQEKEAYEHAKFLNPSYVTNRDFRLMFLRCELFDAKTAANTIVFHFQLKQEIFGSGEILARDVNQSDLSQRELEILSSGIGQILPKRDIAGRTIHFVCGDDTLSIFPGEVLRPYWYMMMAMLRDEELQKKGSIWVTYCFEGAGWDLEHLKEFNKIEVACPQRCVGGHFCYVNSEKRFEATGFQLFMNKHERSRMQVHTGTKQEIDFKLLTFGIPIEDNPLNEDGTRNVENHMKWIQALRATDQDVQSQEGSSIRIIIPKKSDVLFGKNARSRDHPGNLRAHQLVELYFEEYEKASKFQKTDIANVIIGTIHSSGGKFLKQDGANALWVEVTDTVARQKIAHWYRHLRHKAAKMIQKDNLKGFEGTDYQQPTKRVTPCPSPDSFSVPAEKLVRLS